MEKNQLKMYEAPAVEILDVEVQRLLCVSSNADDIGSETPGDRI